MQCSYPLIILSLVLAVETCCAQDKTPNRLTLEQDREFLKSAFNWVQDPPAKRPGGMLINFAGGIFLQHAIDDGKGKLDVRDLFRVPFELKEIDNKRMIVLKEKNDKLSNLMYSLENDRLIIHDGECNLHGKTSLKGKWQRWLGDYSVIGTPRGPCPYALVSDELSYRPLALFFAHSLPDGKARFAYLVLFKIHHHHPKSTYVGKSTFALTEDKFEFTYSFAVDGKKFEVKYAAILDPKTKEVRSDALSLGNFPVKQDAPRVYIVDLTGEKTKYQPVKTELPQGKLDLPKEMAEEPRDWYRPVVRWVNPIMNDINGLKKKSKELQELLRLEPK